MVVVGAADGRLGFDMRPARVVVVGDQLVASDDESS